MIVVAHSSHRRQQQHPARTTKRSRKRGIKKVHYCYGRPSLGTIIAILFFVVVITIAPSANAFSSSSSSSSKNNNKATTTTKTASSSSSSSSKGGQQQKEQPPQQQQPQCCFAIQTAVSAGILIEESKGKGLGAFATTNIPEGAWIGDYEGEIMTAREVRARFWKLEKPKKEDRRWRKSRKRRDQGMSGDYLFSLSDDIYIDAEDTDTSGWCRYMNHASDEGVACNVSSHHDPGVILSDGERQIMPKLWFTAIRDILPGEELLYDYGDDYWEGEKASYG